MSVGRLLLTEHRSVLGAFLAIVEQNLGSPDCTRCVVDADDEKNAVLIKDTYLLLRSLHISHPVGQVVVDACKAHKDLYGCGMKSLLFFMGHLCRGLEQLRNQGVPLCHLEELVHEAVEDCVRQLDSLAIPVRVERKTFHESVPGSFSAMAKIVTQQPGSLNSETDDNLLRQGTPASCSPFSSISSNSTNLLNPLLPGAAKCRHGLLQQAMTTFGGSGEQWVKQTVVSPVTSCLDAVGASQSVPDGVIQARPGRSDINQRLEELLLSPSRRSISAARLHRRGMLSSRHFTQQDKDVNGDRKQSSPHVIHTVSGAVSGGVSELYRTTSEATVQSNTPSGLKPQACSGNFGPGLQSPPSSQDFKGSGSEHTKPFLELPRHAACLSHGSEASVLWVSKMMSQQLASDKRTAFDLNLLHTCSLDGGSRSHEVVSGLVLHTDQQAMEIVSRSDHSSFAALLINGDLTPETKHKGFKETIHAKRVVSSTSPQNVEHSWSSDVVTLLQNLGISLLLVKGRVDSALKDHCAARGIVVLEAVPFRALMILQSACCTELTTYVLESTASNVCRGLLVKPLADEWTDSVASDKNDLVVTCPAAEVLTLVIRHPSPAWREVLEQEFWLYANRLAQAVKDGRVMPGEGLTEKWCQSFLLSSASSASSDGGSIQEGDPGLYRTLVRTALAETFGAFAAVTRSNREKTSFRGTSSGGAEASRCQSFGEGHKPNIPTSKQDSGVCILHTFSDRVSPLPSKDAPVLGYSNCVNERALSTGSSDGNACMSRTFTVQSELDPEAMQYDNFACKIGGWRAAVSCVFLTMKIDTLISTGVDRHTAPTDSVVL